MKKFFLLFALIAYVMAWNGNCCLHRCSKKPRALIKPCFAVCDEARCKE